MLKRELEDYKILLRSVPSMVVAGFILSVVCMNLMASKELYSSEYFCVDCGLTISWISFLCMDCICKRFGAKASIKISILALFVNIVVVGIFKLLTLTPGHWAAYFDATDQAAADQINAGINATFGSSWYVVLGSATAMLISAVVNSVINVFVGKMADKGGYLGFAVRSFVSTGIGQWVDNFVFTSLVSHVFFGWTWPQVLVCATTNMLLELAAEAIFSPLGYRVTKGWTREDVGKDYLEYNKAA